MEQPTYKELSLCSPGGLRLFFIMCILTTIANFPSAFTHTSINTAVSEVNQYLNASYLERGVVLTESHISLIRSAVNCIWYIGQVGGALASPRICDQYGRRFAFLSSVIAVTIGFTIQYLAIFFPYPEIFLSGRVLTAVSSPLMDAALIIYLQECSPAELRGSISSLFSTGYAVTCLLGMMLGHDEILGRSLHWLLLVPVLSGVASIIFLAFVPDTPKFLVIKKRNSAAARKSLQFFQGKRREHAKEIELMVSEGESMEMGEDADGESRRKTEIDGSIKSLFACPLYRRALVLSVCAVVLTLPFFPVLQSSTYLFLKMNIPKNIAQLSSTILMVAFTIACFVSTIVADFASRRKMLIGFASLSLVFLFAFTLCGFTDGYFAMAAVLGYVLCYGLGVGTLVWTISPELVPLSHRSAIFCVCYAIHSTLVVFTNFLSVPLFDNYGPSAFLPLYVAPCILVIAYLYFNLPETKGRETSDILKELRGAEKKRKNRHSAGEEATPLEEKEEKSAFS